MKIAVIGAGIVGITTAYELACDGHEVSVLERRGAVAEEASFANAGILSPSDVSPWAAPGIPGKLIQHFFSRYSPFKVSLPLSRRELAWMWKWYCACKPDIYLANRTNLQHLSFYSRERLHHITADLKLEYERSDGYMMMLRSEQDSNALQPGLHLLRDAGVAFKVLDEGQARKIENALNPETAFFGAIHLPDDEVGNCRQFALLLKNEAQRLGVKFSFNHTVTQIGTSAGVSLTISGEEVPRHYDAAVICAGLDSARLLEPFGLQIPMAAVYGYSISANIREPLNAPRSAIMDSRYKIAISRLGNRVRVAGGSEFGGVPHKKCANSVQNLYKVLHDWFPGAANLSSGVQEWKGARPMLPDGPPILGSSGIAGIWLNLGHGDSGWILSCGSAKVLADQISGRSVDLDISGFGVDRLHF